MSDDRRSHGDRRRGEDRRASARNPARLAVRFAASGSEGRGVLTDVSYAGARVEECSWLPPLGAVAIVFLEVPGVGPLELSGTVQRESESGFALAYEVEDLAGRERVDRLTALLFAAASDAPR